MQAFDVSYKAGRCDIVSKHLHGEWMKGYSMWNKDAFLINSWLVPACMSRTFIVCGNVVMLVLNSHVFYSLVVQSVVALSLPW